jgi:hypothetical protein
MSSSSKSDLRVDWATHAAAKYACEHWHYSGSVPVPPLVKIGVWEAGSFIGAVLFSRGASPSLLKPYGLAQTEGCELTRIALTTHSATVSRIVRLAIAFLKKQSPGLRLIVSFADPDEGHHGGVCQAGNWIYCGKSCSSREYLDANGKRWHSRMVVKKGWTIVNGFIYQTLTPDQCTKAIKPGKHRYLMPLDPEMRAKILPLAQPYPKRPKQATPATSGEAAGQNRPGRSNPPTAGTDEPA